MTLPNFSRSNDCEEYGSVNRKKVCQARAHVLKKLNGDDEDIFIYSDARSTHDVIASSEGEKIIRVHKSGSQFVSYQSNRRFKHVGYFTYYFGRR